MNKSPDFVGLDNYARGAHRPGVLHRDQEHCVLHRRQRRGPPPASAWPSRCCSTPTCWASRTKAPLPGDLHPPVAVHRRDHRGAVANAARPERRRELPAHQPRPHRLDRRVARDPAHRAARGDVHQHLGRLPVLHGQPARRPAGHPARAVRGGHASTAPARSSSSGTSPSRSCRPIIISMALLDFIWTSQQFALIWMTTGGGPINVTEMLSTYTYKLAFASTSSRWPRRAPCSSC